MKKLLMTLAVLISSRQVLGYDVGMVYNKHGLLIIELIDSHGKHHLMRLPEHDADSEAGANSIDDRMRAIEARYERH